MYNSSKSLPFILTTFIVILLVSNSTSAGISSTIFFQNGVGEITQNNLVTSNVFASPDEASDENNEDAGEDSQGLPDEASDENNEDAGEDSQGLQDVSENITTVNPSLTALSESPQNEQCPAGSPPGCYVLEDQGNPRQGCPQGTQWVKNTPGGPTGTMCAPLPPENQNNPNDVIGIQEQLPSNSILTTTPTTQDSTIKEQLPANSILTTNTFDPDAKPILASCEAQGTLSDPATNMCKYPQSIQDCAKVMQRYDPNQGKCIRFIT